jgi:hypothetical protein
MEILVHPGQENHGPPEPIRICRLPVKDGSSKQEQAAFPRKLGLQSMKFEESGFRNTL